MLVLEPKNNQADKDIALINKLAYNEYENALSFLMPASNAELIEKELIDKWGVGGYDGSVLLLMSRKTLKVEKTEIVLKRWMQLNNEDIFRDKIVDIKEYLTHFRIRLQFEPDDVLLSAKLKACSKLIADTIEEHREFLSAKYRQLVYEDDFGNTILKDFERELSPFCKNVFEKKYEYSIVAEYAHDILYRKCWQLAENHILGTDKNQILKIAQKQFESQYDRELESFIKYFFLAHFRHIRLKRDIYTSPIQ